MDNEKPKEKSAWQYFKDGFKPTQVRAQEEAAEDRTKYGDQLRVDMRKSKEERIDKFKRGFFDRK